MGALHAERTDRNVFEACRLAEGGSLDLQFLPFLEGMQTPLPECTVLIPQSNKAHLRPEIE
jgi:hypothetical protein